MEPAVLVAGAGPVGLTMALELTRFGIPVRIIDKAAARTDKSKALVLWSRTLELMDRGGYSQAFVDAGFKVTGANIYAGPRRVAHVQLDELQTPHSYALMLPQSDTERLLEEQLNARGVKIERQVELTRFTADADKIIATLQSADGREEMLTVPWLIGCDGAHSAVRHGLGMQFVGNTMLSDWILADVHLQGLTDNANEVNTYWHADGVLVLFPISPGRYRMIADVGEVKTDQCRPDPTLEEVQAIVDQRGPGGLVVSSPIWLASFRINERKVADYRAGRVFLAGDAAHIHSPAGGQGMNTGMQDAFNLSWKLALVHHGLACAEPLLGSYSIERSAVGQQVLIDAGRLTALATLRSSPWQQLRNHVASFAFGMTAVRQTMATKLTELSIGYPHSPLTVINKHGHARPAAGERVPVTDSSNLTTQGATPRFVLHALRDPQSANIIERHTKVLAPALRPPFDEDHIWLVRPDGYVATVVAKGEWDQIDSYLTHICGR
ncbi:MAG TPA: FAD-dependent monooxygenase [Schlesneria sp.]|jgi:2-polyprenyl-6-methoxyphenol hydroxylase-like FAD-dependent oxidoreductase